MSTPEQPLTRKQMRELLRTGAIPIIRPDEAAKREQADASADRVADAAPRIDDEPIDPDATPRTRRQARQQERLRTLSVPIISPELAEAALAADAVEADVADVEAPSSDVEAAEAALPEAAEVEVEDAVEAATGDEAAVEPERDQPESEAGDAADAEPSHVEASDALEIAEADVAELDAAAEAEIADAAEGADEDADADGPAETSADEAFVDDADADAAVEQALDADATEAELTTAEADDVAEADATPAQLADASEAEGAETPADDAAEASAAPADDATLDAAAAEGDAGAAGDAEAHGASDAAASQTPEAHSPAVGESEAEAADAADAPTGSALHAGFGGHLLVDDPEIAAPMPASFDQLIARGSTATGSATATNALILSQTPVSAPLSGAVTATGEILFTGTLALPEGLGSTGSDPRLSDGKEIDALLVDGGELPASSSPKPVAASAAISTIKSASEIIKPPVPEKGSRLMFALAITAGALALALVGVLILGFVTGAL